MTTIYLVRHAHSTYSTDERNRPLSTQGKQDAEALVSVFQNIAVDHVYTSLYKRARETVQPLAANRGLAVKEQPNFAERVLAPGALADFQEAVRFVWEHPDENPYGGESNQVATERVVASTIELLRTHQDEVLVIGTHGNIMALLMQHFDAQYDYAFWQTLPMPAVYRLDFEGECYSGSRQVTR